jgi:hypothetical protein
MPIRKITLLRRIQGLGGEMSRTFKSALNALRAGSCVIAAATLGFVASGPAHAVGDVSVDWLSTRIGNAIEALPSDATVCDVEAAVQRVLRHADADALIEVLAIASVQASGVYNMRVYDALTHVDNLQPRGVDGYTPDSPLTTSCNQPDPCGSWPEIDEPEVPPAPEPQPMPEPQPIPEPIPAPEPAPVPPVVAEVLPEDDLVDDLERDIRRRPRDATQCEYEAGIRAVLGRSGQGRHVQLAALRSVRGGVAGGLALRRAIAYVIQHLPSGSGGYSFRSGVGDNMIELCGRRDWPAGGGNPRPPLPPPSGGGGSDYN